MRSNSGERSLREPRKTLTPFQPRPWIFMSTSSSTDTFL